MASLNDSRVIGGIVEDRFAVRAATAMASTPHVQHGAGVFIGLDGDVTVVAGAGRIVGRVVMVPPDLVHAAACAGPTLGFLFDPEAEPAVAATAAAGPVVLDGVAGARLAGAARAHRAGLDRMDVLAGLGDEVARLLAGTPRRIDRRVWRVVEALRDLDADPRAAIAATGLSRAHLQALFARDVGVSMRTYRLWRRLLAAVRGMVGSSATGAAHAAGFADLAHFSRTCRRMFGYTPVGLRGGYDQRSG